MTTYSLANFSFLLIILTGCIFIYTSSSIFAFEVYNDSFFFIKKHLVGLAIGFILFFIISCFSEKFFKKNAITIFIASLLINFLPLLPRIGASLNGASRWISLFGQTFQTSELLKPAFIIFLSFFLDKFYYVINQQYILLIISAILPCSILLLQSDFGQIVILLALLLIGLFLCNIKIEKIIKLSFVCLLCCSIFIVIKPYRFYRLISYLYPYKDPLGSGFQIIQSLVALYNGGLFGLGIGNSKQKFFYLPMQHTDFIAAIIGEEIGLIGLSFIIILYSIQHICLIIISRSQKSLFSKLIIQLIAHLIIVQAHFNILVVLGVLPTKGIGLPFISAGNSSIIGFLINLGIIKALIKNNV